MIMKKIKREFRWDETGKNEIIINEPQVFDHALFWKRWCGPTLNEKRNIIEFRITKFNKNEVRNYMYHSPKHESFIIGIVNLNHQPHQLQVGSTKREWGLMSDGMKITDEKTSKFSKFEIQENMTIRMIYDRKIQTLSFEIDGKNPRIAFRNVRGKGLRVGISTYAKVFSIHARYVHNRQEKNLEEIERIDYILNDLGFFEIELANKNLSVWKTFFVNSSILDDITNNQMTRYDGLKDKKLSISEDILLEYFFITRDYYKLQELPSESLPDYFLFFKHFGMWNECFFILRFIEQEYPSKPFKEVFILFRDFCENHESEETQKVLFDERSYVKRTSEYFMKNKNSVYPEETINFIHLYSRIIFTGMKNRKPEDRNFGKKNQEITNTEEEIEEDGENKKGLVTIQFHLENEILRITSSDDQQLRKYTKNELFLDEEEEEEETFGPKKFSMFPIQATLDRLFKLRELSNLLICSNDGMKCFVHKEILIWRMNFFYKLVGFGGMETESMNMNNEITFYDLNENETKYLVELIYTSDIYTKNYNNKKKDILIDLVSLYIHLEKFVEVELRKELKDVIRRVVMLESTIGKIKNVIKEFGIVFKRNKNLRIELIESVFQKRVERKKIMSIVNNSAPNFW